MMRTTSLAAAGLTAVGMTLGSLPAAQAAPLPAMNAVQVGGPTVGTEKVGWRRGYYGGYGGYGYRRRGVGVGGALAAGAALGLLGGALAASAAPRYGYYGRPAYGYGGYDGGYGYRPVYGGYGGYGYGYGGPAYGGYYGY